MTVWGENKRRLYSWDRDAHLINMCINKIENGNEKLVKETTT